MPSIEQRRYNEMRGFFAPPRMTTFVFMSDRLVGIGWIAGELVEEAVPGFAVLVPSSEIFDPA
jgi:hypothetical protein